MNIWASSFPVPFGALDASGLARPAAIFDFFQEAAINHAESLGVGKAAMQERNQLWVLSRISVAVDRRPGYHEPVTVRSWPRGSSRLFAVRDYDIRDTSDKAIVRARSGWLILDTEKRRPLRPEIVMSSLPLNEGVDALDEKPAALAGRTNLVKTAERAAAYSDIDGNGHTNNVRYIEWIQDITEHTLLENARRFRLAINYLSEVKQGEIVELFSGDLSEDGQNSLVVEGRRKGEDTAVFRAEMTLNP
jgi:acyl-ACP thioesterase